jgi:hypothetical protein
LIWLSSYVASSNIAVVLHSGVKDQYCSISNCDAQGVSKNWKKLWKMGLEAKINKWVI